MMNGYGLGRSAHKPIQGGIVHLQPTAQNDGNREERKSRKLARKPGTNNILDRQWYRSLFREGYNKFPEGRKINSSRNKSL